MPARVSTGTFVALWVASAMVVSEHSSERAFADPTDSANEVSVFEMPGIYERVAKLRAEIDLLFRQGEFTTAERKATSITKLLPNEPVGYYILATVLMRLDKADAAMVSLTRAVRLGMRDSLRLKNNPDFVPLHARDGWKSLVTTADSPFREEPNTVTVRPEVIASQVALVKESNSLWDPRTERIHSFFRQARSDRNSTLGVATGNDVTSQLLRKWLEEGTASGHKGILYDNHDRDHSSLDLLQFPQLTRIEYSEAAKKLNLDNGAQNLFVFNGIVFGNSSTAIVNSPYWRSQPRLMFCRPQAINALTLQYFGNHIYVYPEHRDYDPGTNGDGGFGDVFPANTPYVIISQGSSSSDRVFMKAVAATLAAFQPETRQRLAKASALMPCLQMIFRICNSQVRTPRDYLTGIAHPPVFQGKQIQEVKMVRMAHDMVPESLPPLAILEVIDEDVFEPGRDYFEAGQREALFTTPAAVARVCHAVARTRRMTVSAAKSRDLNGQPLTWHWSVLQGDPSLVEIEPQNPEQSEVSISVNHQERRRISPDSAMESSRIDIGVFVHNGRYYSAPAFISFYWPENATRRYTADGRVLSVEYRTTDAGGLYTDPVLVTGRNWRDEYLYDANKGLLGWHRIRGISRERFTRNGELVTLSDEFNRPVEAAVIGYGIDISKQRVPVLVQRRTGVTVRYEYASTKDQIGTVVTDPSNQTSR